MSFTVVTEAFQLPAEVDPSIPNTPKKRAVLEIEKKICNEIKQVEAEIRAQYPIFHPKYQDALGLIIFLGALFMIGLTCYLYLTNQDHPWAIPIAIVSVAYWTSFVHEFEHDLIHNLYFKSNETVHNALYFLVWFVKANYSPWARRYYHLRHHRVSGQLDDVEERVIGLGLPFGWKRLVATSHPIGMLLTLYEIEKDNPTMDSTELILSSAPAVGPVMIALTTFLTIQCGELFFPSLANSAFAKSTCFEWIYHFNILIILPMILRQCCLLLLGNLSHYYGDIPANSLFYQNQILDHWFFIPFQFFCCNFGATHIVHHYVPQQPFYLREMIFHRVRDFLVAQGVRRNDLSIVIRGNRYFESIEEARQVVGTEKFIPPLPITLEARIVTSFLSNESIMFLWSFAFIIAASVCFPFVNLLTIYAFAYRVVMKDILHKKQF